MPFSSLSFMICRVLLNCEASLSTTHRHLRNHKSNTNIEEAMIAAQLMIYSKCTLQNINQNRLAPHRHLATKPFYTESADSMTSASITRPDWWEQKEACNGTKFYYNIATNQRTKLDPSRGALPPGWTEYAVNGEIKAIQQRTGIIAKLDPRCCDPKREKRVAATIHDWTAHMASPLYNEPGAHNVLRAIWKDVEMHLPEFRRDLEDYKRRWALGMPTAKLVEKLEDNLQAIETWRAVAEIEVENLEKEAVASGKNTQLKGLRKTFEGFRDAVDGAVKEKTLDWVKVEYNIGLIKKLEDFFASLREGGRETLQQHSCPQWI